MTETSYTPLTFETEIFGKPVWRLNDISCAREVVHLAQKQNVTIISYRENGSEEDLSFLEQAGFYSVEMLTTLERKINPETKWPDHIQIANIDDASSVAEIAGKCFSDDRYHIDKAIDNKIADAIKSQWMYNAVSGRADIVFLYKEAGKILGFNSCMLRDKVASIDLIGVLPNLQRRGVGKALVQAMENHYAGKAAFLRLGTQAANLKSQKFYQKLGFQEIYRRQTWHWTNKS
ncbi:GNAT family N-acetyltransferase [Curvivirga sp.]|uniref:GNAT family N-acetyltransferase n=1 Tax=Curvivirga sp. TaxID=2856848 RepID=UPI003B5AE981